MDSVYSGRLIQIHGIIIILPPRPRAAFLLGQRRALLWVEHLGHDGRFALLLLAPALRVEPPHLRARRVRAPRICIHKGAAAQEDFGDLDQVVRLELLALHFAVDAGCDFVFNVVRRVGFVVAIGLGRRGEQEKDKAGTAPFPGSTPLAQRQSRRTWEGRTTNGPRAA